ncbi:MAG: class II fumarate hydratase [Gammaproteobacteria bacterium]
MSAERGFRREHDSMGEVQVPTEALYGAQTQRAVLNFPISGLRMPRPLIRALGLIKACAARVNGELELLPADVAEAVANAATEVEAGGHDGQFPVDVFQTGSGTSTNMNANEVIARLATRSLGRAVHANDDVNRSQSSNDVIPTAIHVAAVLELQARLLPAVHRLQQAIENRAAEFDDVVKTGRTHLMDAMPLTLGQELGAWASQLQRAAARIEDSSSRLYALAQGGTAIGTGINAHPEFGRRFAQRLSGATGLPFRPAPNSFEALASQDSAVEMSGQLRVLATALMKIANDLRWMNSGPLTGLAEVSLPALQPGSSIMPGKVNPVIPEAVAMVCAQVTGNDMTITVAGQSGNFQLNVMLPVIAHNLLQSIDLLTNAMDALREKTIDGLTVNRERLGAQLQRNPILVTALNARIGYEKAAAIAKRAYAEGRPILEVAAEMTDIGADELERLLDPRHLTGPG